MIIMGLEYLSDYASASSSNGGTPWSQEDHQQMQELRCFLREMSLDDRSHAHAQAQRTNSLSSLSSKPVDDVMEEFRLNGSDSPYDPDEDDTWLPHTGRLTGMGPAGAYLRQKSWPAPEASPAAPLPSPPPMPALGVKRPAPNDWRNEAGPSSAPLVTAEQARVLATLPSAVLYALLRELSEQRQCPKTFDECRFCKNNGERESYYRSHALKDARGRVACPVLRAFVCRRCGARGDSAHTIKYCPLSTDLERQKSVAMMRSVRLASGRKRLVAPPGGGGAQQLERRRDDAACSAPAPLDPVWAALEKKLEWN